ncbi:sugar ABC transporter permease [Hydrogenispora sp. UU3]|uniref:Sugar ABC transporter permease n=1 Tax=Capillibacterium thermochitinicola TaxID=2699427 RepID=A0A8J6I2W6_9FIRM|nr:sugar ABC transporter permease [Capillibacterium thermochitinicola]
MATLVMKEKPKGRFRRWFGSNGLLRPYFYLLPHAVFFFMFLVYPIFKGFYISLTEWDIFANSGRFIGLGNYRLLFDPAAIQNVYFWQALRNTLIFVVISVPLLVLVALGLALLLTSRLSGRSVFRTIFFMPTALTVSVVAVIWRWLLNVDHGFVNFLLEKVGIKGVPWLTSQPWAWISITIATVWWTVGWNMILLINGINGVPEEIYEASKIDGANAWQRLLYITLPCLRPVLLFVCITTVIASFNLFGQPQLMTGGGPARSTLPVMMQIYTEAWANYRMGPAGAMSYLTALIMIVFTVFQSKLFAQRADD